MITTNSAVFSRIKSFFKKSKSFIGFLILLCMLIGFVYSSFWFLAMSSDGILKYTEHIFLPFAQFLNPNITGLDVYLRTSLYLFGAIIPLWLLSIILEKIEEMLINFVNKSIELNEQRLAIENQKKILKQYDEISSFSICLSLDYKINNQKQITSKVVYEKIASVFPDLNANINKTLIFSSNNFKKFDEIYEKLLKVLSKIKKRIETKHATEVIFSITTDAYRTKQLDFETIEKEHFEILSFNFKNKASTSALFLKKYKFVNENKYGGIPIGAYNSLDMNNDKTYELNIVDKNLSKTLNNLK